jgi:hypothetical protein
MQFPTLKTFLICREIDGTIEGDGQFSLRDVLVGGITLEKPLAENETASVPLSIYAELWTCEPIKPGAFGVELVSAAGVPVQDRPGSQPESCRVEFPNVPGGAAIAIKWTLDSVPLGKMVMRPFWGDRLLGEFPFGVSNPRSL